MRVTDNMVSEVSRQGMASARSATLKATRVATTGLRVESPGDDAAAAADARRLKGEAARIAATMETSDEASRGLEVVDSALAQMNDILAQARSLAIQGANETLGPGERSIIADEIASLRSSLLDTTRAQIDGRFVLNGLREDAAPYDATGAFVGDRNQRDVEASPGHFVSTGLAIGNVLSPGGGPDVLADLTALEAALRADDTTLIRTGIDAMAAGGDRVAAARGDVGSRMQSFDMAYSLGERLSERMTADIAAAVEADPFDALSEFQRAQAALEQAVSLAARLPLPGLVQTMR